MAPRTSTRWLLACAGSAVLLGAVVLLLVQRRRAPEAAAPSPAAACEPLVADLPRAQPDAEGPPVILWAEGDVRIFVDGKAAFSPPEAPLRFAVGEHLLRLEADGAEPVETRVALSAFTPALFHAQRDPELGITLVRLGSRCTNCAVPLTDVELDRIPVPRAVSLGDAAAALRADDWSRARPLLQQASSPQRSAPAYPRLVSAFWAQTGDDARATQAAEGIAAGELPALLARHRALAQEESARQAQVVLARWNRLTEQHAALMRAAAPLSDADFNRSSHRLQELSGAFNAATERHDPLEAERVFLAAEQTVKALLAQVANASGGDCAAQNSVLQALAGSGSVP